MEELATKGYQKSVLGDDWRGAIVIWDEAIKRYPKERRFFNNRSFCFFQLKEYERALADANYMTNNFRDYARGHFRKGEILATMGRFAEAEASFLKVLRLEPTCDEAKKELAEVQIKRLCSLGFTRYQAVNAYLISTNLNEAARLLMQGCFPIDSRHRDEIYESDDDTLSVGSSGHYDPLEDPDNPMKISSIWVGNMTDKISDEELKKMFTKYGKVKSVKGCFDQYCAFVNFVDYEGAAKAMRQLQGKDLGGNKNVKIRYPDKAAQHSK